MLRSVVEQELDHGRAPELRRPDQCLVGGGEPAHLLEPAQRGGRGDVVDPRTAADERLGGFEVAEAERGHQRRPVVLESVDRGAVVEQHVDELALASAACGWALDTSRFMRGLVRAAAVGVGERVDRGARVEQARARSPPRWAASAAGSPRRRSRRRSAGGSRDVGAATRAWTSATSTAARSPPTTASAAASNARSAPSTCRANASQESNPMRPRDPCLGIACASQRLRDRPLDAAAHELGGGRRDRGAPALHRAGLEVARVRCSMSGCGGSGTTSISARRARPSGARGSARPRARTPPAHRRPRTRR